MGRPPRRHQNASRELQQLPQTELGALPVVGFMGSLVIAVISGLIVHAVTRQVTK